MGYVRLLSKLSPAFLANISAAFIVVALTGCSAAHAGGNVEAPTNTSSETSTPAVIATRPLDVAAVATDAPVRTPVNDPRPVIACFGDSITAGHGVDPDASYPANLQRLLDADGYKYRVANLGVSGETTKDGLSRIPHLINAHPAIVIVEFGGNDGLRGLPTSTTQNNLAQIVAQIKRSGARVVLAGISLPPDYGQDYVSRFNAMFPTVARQQHVPLLPFIYKGVYGVPGSIQSDRVHATAQGNRQVARNVEEAIKPLLHH